MERVSIGLDIGASAVRAAEVVSDSGRPVLRRYGQVGLDPGVVREGEAVNESALADALKRLWSHGGFAARRVVLGVSGHRVVVRQADVPALDDEDLRSSLRFNGQELIPIPMDDACFDFTILDHGDAAGEDGKRTMSILLAAAHRHLVEGYLRALRLAGLEAVAVDAAAVALLRVAPVSPGGGGDAIVSIGAEQTTVAVRVDGLPRFVRSLSVGGSELTAGIANALHVDVAVAEALKRGGLGTGSREAADARTILAGQVAGLAEEVRATVDFFASQGAGAVVDRVLLTGGAAQTVGLRHALDAGIDLPVVEADPFSVVALGDTGLSDAQIGRARASAATALGLALWELAPPPTRLSLLPPEVAAARRVRRLRRQAAAGLVVLVAALAAASVTKVVQIHRVDHQVATAQALARQEQQTIVTLTARTAAHREVAQQARIVASALQGDIDFVGLLDQLSATMPANLSLTSLSALRAAPSTPTPAPGAARQASPGSLTVTVTGPGGLPAVAAWLQGLSLDHDLTGTWVSGIDVAPGGTVSFSSTTSLTPAALSGRAAAVGK